MNTNIHQFRDGRYFKFLLNKFDGNKSMQKMSQMEKWDNIWLQWLTKVRQGKKYSILFVLVNPTWIDTRNKWWVSPWQNMLIYWKNLWKMRGNLEWKNLRDISFCHLKMVLYKWRVCTYMCGYNIWEIFKKYRKSAVIINGNLYLTIKSRKDNWWIRMVYQFPLGCGKC